MRDKVNDRYAVPQRLHVLRYAAESCDMLYFVKKGDMDSLARFASGLDMASSGPRLLHCFLMSRLRDTRYEIRDTHRGFPSFPSRKSISHLPTQELHYEEELYNQVNVCCCLEHCPRKCAAPRPSYGIGNFLCIVLIGRFVTRLISVI